MPLQGWLLRYCVEFGTRPTTFLSRLWCTVSSLKRYNVSISYSTLAL